jgi:iron complex outermembrane receptor protein
MAVHTRCFAKATGFGVISFVLLSTPAHIAYAQAASPAPAAQLPPVVVESPKVRRARPKASQNTGHSRVATRNARTSGGHGNAAVPVAGAGAGTLRVESAWGHVDGYVATRSGTGTKTDTPLIETPAAISVVTQDQIQAQAAQNVAQAVRYTSGTRAEVTGADTRFDYVYVRGFLADTYLDGMKLFTTGFTQSVIEPFNLERIEVLHGPASVLYGQASPGGLLDLVSKRPTEDPYHEMFLSTGSYGRIQGGVDLSGPIDEEKKWLYRFTASGLDVGSQVDFTRYERVSIAPSLTWRPDTDTKITLLGAYQNDPQGGFYNQLPTAGYGTIFPLANGQHIPTSFYPGVPSQDTFSRELGQIGYLAEHRFDDVWTIRQNLRYTDTSTQVSTVYPTGASLTDPNSLARSAFFENDRLQAFTIDNQAEAKFLTGPFSHTVPFWD